MAARSHKAWSVAARSNPAAAASNSSSTSEASDAGIGSLDAGSNSMNTCVPLGWALTSSSSPFAV